MTGIAAVLIAFTLYVLTHWLICRTTQWRPYSRVINLLWLCFLPVFSGVFFLLGGRLDTVLSVVDLLNGLLLNLLLLLGYTYFFFLVERGFSLRLMIEIDKSPQGQLTIPEIQQLYTYDYILDKRLGQMAKMGYAKIDGEVIIGTAKSARLTAVNKLVRKILRVEQVMP